MVKDFKDVFLSPPKPTRLSTPAGLNLLQTAQAAKHWDIVGRPWSSASHQTPVVTILELERTLPMAI